MKPRQVLLSSSSENRSNGKPRSLTPEQRPLLLQAICHFLHSNDFSKTLHKFLSEASIQRDSWKSCLLNLEDACCMYLDARSQNNADDNSTDSEPKEKKKKKRENVMQNVEAHHIEAESTLRDSLSEEKSSKKAKDKKEKKRSKSETESPNKELKATCEEERSKGSTDAEKSLKSKSEWKKNPEDATEQEKKSLKKRKKSFTDENKVDGLVEAYKDSKRRKTGGSGDGETDEPAKKATMQLENGEVGTQTPSINGKHSKVLPEENCEDKSAVKNSSAKKQNVSTEPRSLNAFQRVKADDVEFLDERLQDNSYCAKKRKREEFSYTSESLESSSGINMSRLSVRQRRETKEREAREREAAEIQGKVDVLMSKITSDLWTMEQLCLFLRQIYHARFLVKPYDKRKYGYGWNRNNLWKKILSESSLKGLFTVKELQRKIMSLQTIYSNDNDLKHLDTKEEYKAFTDLLTMVFPIDTPPQWSEDHDRGIVALPPAFYSTDETAKERFLQNWQVEYILGEN